jgi:hypothetical protein
VARTLWLKTTTDEWVPWACPTCGGPLKLSEKPIKTYETKASQDAHDDADWDPEWVSYRFATLLLCDSLICGEPVVAVGRGSNFPIRDEVDEQWEVRLEPLFFVPPLQIIRIPDDCPSDVREELLSAFSLFWSEVRSAANRIRSAIEKLLTHLKVPIDASQGHGWLSLDKPIQIFGEQDKQLAEHMKAIKWLGNYGSHASVLTRNDLLDAFEILEHLLATSQISRISKAINEARGPRGG